MPLVLSVSEICPRNRKPRLVRSIKICRTISPRYIPLHIFSYLWCKRINTAVSVSCKDALLTRDTICFLFFPLNIFFCLLFDPVLLNRPRCWGGEYSTEAGVAILLFVKQLGTSSILTFVCLRWVSSHPLPGRMLSWCHPDSHCLQMPPTPYWHTSDPRYPALSQCSSFLPYNKHCCPFLSVYTARAVTSEKNYQISFLFLKKQIFSNCRLVLG